MPVLRLDIDERQIVLHTDGTLCETTQELVESDAFARVVGLYVDHLEAHNPRLLDELGLAGRRRRQLLELLRLLANNPLDRVGRGYAGEDDLPAHRERLHEFVEGLYDFWRGYDRFMICHGEAQAADEPRQYRSFNETVERFGQLVRAAYRDIAEHVTGSHPRVYRQVAAGSEVSVIAAQRHAALPARYRELLGGIPFVRHVLMYPPLLLDPPTTTRTGQFLEVDEDPLAGLRLEREQWLCFPVLVGPLTVFVYFEQRFAGLGLSLANLFEMASDDDLAAGPDAIYVYGAPPESLARFGELPTVFHDDPAARVLVAAVPLEDRFGYFGYLKKMVLTLHNLAVMRRGRMPFHGAYTRIVLADGAAANVLLLGDTATGKSESLEALRLLGEDRIRELRIIADDMGSLEVTEDGVRGYGTEIGAFVRLDDLQQGYAFGQMDRAVIMSPQRVNARVVLPVTTLEEVLRGHRVDVLLYANNYEQVDEGHPLIEEFDRGGAGHDGVPRGQGPVEGDDDVDGPDDDLLRQHLRSGAAGRGARGAGPQDVRRRLRRERLRRPAPHPPRRPRSRIGRTSRRRRSPARPHRQTGHHERSRAFMTVLYESNETAWPLLSRGKVRDVYGFGPDELLIVTSDRISAFDVIMPTPIPEKGSVLTQISNFWFGKTGHIVPNHIVDPAPFADDAAHAHLDGRSVVVRRAQSLPVEAIVRGYLTGSGRKDYERTGMVSAASGCPRALSRPAACRSRSSRRRPRPRSATTTRTSTSTASSGSSAGSSPNRSATPRWPSTASAPRTPSSAASSSPTPSSSSACSTAG